MDTEPGVAAFEMDVDDTMANSTSPVVKSSSIPRIQSSDENEDEEDSMPITSSASRIKRKTRACAFLRDDSDVENEDLDMTVDASVNNINHDAEANSSEDDAIDAPLNKSKARRSVFQIQDDSDFDNQDIDERPQVVSDRLDSNSDHTQLPSLSASMYGKVEAKTKQKKNTRPKKSILKTVPADGDSSEEEQKELHEENDQPDKAPINIVKEKLKALVRRRQSRKHRTGQKAADQPELEKSSAIPASGTSATTVDDIEPPKFYGEQEKATTGTLTEASFMANSDLFDAEGSSDDDAADRRAKDTDKSDASNDEDGLFDIKKKAKNSAAKAAKKASTSSSRPKRENVQQLHSESQRLLRESRTRLPRHVPLKKTLDEFLGRRKMVPKSLRAGEGDIESVMKNVAIRNVADEGKPEIIASNSIAVTMSIEEHEGNLTLPSFELSSLSTVEETTSVTVSNGDDTQLPDIDVVMSESDLPKELSTSPFKDPQEEERLKHVIALKPVIEVESLDSQKMIDLDLIESTIGFDNDGQHLGGKSFDKRKQRISMLNPRLISRTPKLAGTPQQVIFLDGEDVEDAGSKNGVEDLIHRFVRHTSANKPKRLPQNQPVTLNILKKETDGEGREQLNMECVMIDVSPDETYVHQTGFTPGSRLKLLKDGLKMTLSVKREESRQRRIKEYKMNNESESQDEEEEEEEEEILSDETSSGESEIEDEASVEMKEKKRERSAFVDDEAADDEEEDEEDEIMQDEDELDDKDSSPVIEKLEDETSLKTFPVASLDVNRNDERFSLERCDTMELFPSSIAEKCEHKDEASFNNSINSSLELIGSLNPAQHRFSSNNDSDEPVLQCDNQGFGVLQFLGCVASQPSQRQSQLSLRRQFGFANDSQKENIDELFDLCSGKWAGDDFKDLGVAPLCNLPSQCTQENEAELFGLCSGKFGDEDPITIESMTQDALNPAIDVSRDLPEEFPTMSDDDDRSTSSHISLDVAHVRKRKTRRVISDTESEVGDAPEAESEVEAEGQDVNKPIGSLFRNGASEFFEDEAELSGSEASSDEDEEIAAEDDILEQELGDEEYLSEEDLREQVEKVHHKMLMDDDQKQLRIYKELYLEDGDMHSDEQTRLKKFRWRNIDDTQDDNNDARSDASDGEIVDDGIDVQFRAQRHEREKWMTEYTNSQHEDVLLSNADSGFEQLSKNITILSRQDSLGLDTPPPTCKPSQSPSRSKKFVHRGSFLNSRGKDYLAKLVGQTKPMNGTSNGQVSKMKGPNNSRNFVFATVSPPPPPPSSKLEAKPAQVLNLELGIKPIYQNSRT